MQVRDDLKETKIEHITAVLTGDGRKEFRILRALGEKYDGKEKILFFPALARLFHGNGLQALRAVRTYLDVYGVTKILFIADRDAIEEELLTEVRNILTSCGISVLDMKAFCVVEEDAMLITSSIGSREVIIHIAINGREKEVEENIAKLIELEYSEKIEPSEIKRTLSSLGLTLEILLRSAKKKNIALAFPSLDIVLRHIEKG